MDVQQDLEDGWTLCSVFPQHGAYASMSQCTIFEKEERTNQAVHLCGVHRIWGNLVLHIQNGERSVFLEWSSVVAKFVEEHT